jgi:hypothetical protein
MVIIDPSIERGEFLDYYSLLKNELLQGLTLIFLFRCERFLFNSVNEIKSINSSVKLNPVSENNECHYTMDSLLLCFNEEACHLYVRSLFSESVVLNYQHDKERFSASQSNYRELQNTITTKHHGVRVLLSHYYLGTRKGDTNTAVTSVLKTMSCVSLIISRPNLI